MAPPWGHNFNMELHRKNFRNIPVPSHKAYAGCLNYSPGVKFSPHSRGHKFSYKAYGYQILHVALSSGPLPTGVNYNPRVKLIAKGYIVKSFEIFLLLNIRNMATNFSPCYGSYVLNQFPSIVMFGMKGFHVSASGTIQGHHGLLVRITHPIWMKLHRNNPAVALFGISLKNLIPVKVFCPF